jgi:hypothetical protein
VPAAADPVAAGVGQAHADQQVATAVQTRPVQEQQAAASAGGQAQAGPVGAPDTNAVAGPAMPPGFVNAVGPRMPPAPTRQLDPTPAPAPSNGANWFSDLLGGWENSLRGPQQGRSMEQRIDDMVAGQPTPEARAAAARLAGPLKMGAGVAGLVGTLAMPAAVVAPALAAGVSASDQYGDAGGIVSGATTGAAALAGGVLGDQVGKLIPFGPGRGSRMAASVIGSLAGSGAGALVSGGANAAAQAAVDRANAGRGGIVSDVGRMLDAMGYQGTNDAIRSQMAAMEANPMVQLAKAQKRADEEKARNEMVQQIYLQALSRGIG